MQTLNNIKNLIYSIKNNDIEKITVEQENNEVIISKIKKQRPNSFIKKNINYNSNLKKVHNNRISQISEIGVNNNQIQNNKVIDQPSKYSTIISPMVGNFYRSPAPNEPPFIELNQLVKPKQTVCIIEAMKLMNEIESEVQGEIVEILVKDGDIVDCGQALMKVKINKS
uniref:Biotin carboxyl carrier protein of acetyl-CoA carboxylase n=1 Tax=Chondria sp. (in: red algae) TaxID=1982705 RepID=A0A1Z1MCD2_9FLOR|nr:acetyl-CoA carboxylase biotin carboxyl carrier protein [Chondria sp. (in: red algae)]